MALSRNPLTETARNAADTPQEEGRSWALALFGTQHAASVTVGVTLPLDELPAEFHNGMHYAVRVNHDARPISTDAGER